MSTRARIASVLIVVVGLAFAPDAFTQAGFVDDAKRQVVLPPRVARVFAAGAPAEVLLYTLVPEMLVGRNRVPDAAAREFFPPAYRDPILIRQLPEVDNPAYDAELVALKPDVYVDYGTVHEDYIASVEAVQRRTRTSGIILDGALARIPDAYRRLGAALGVAVRGQELATLVDRTLTKYRGALARGAAPVRVYLACSADGVVPCVADESAGEQLAWLGGTNVAGTRAESPRRPLTIDEIQKMSPDVIVLAGGGGAAANLRANPDWQRVKAVAAGRVYQFPALPYGWGPRPPSVNRLPGLVWLAAVASGRGLDATFEEDVRALFKAMYHIDLSPALLRTLTAG
jgi:iron complex transport system substrate-binding protein